MKLWAFSARTLLILITGPTGSVASAKPANQPPAARNRNGIERIETPFDSPRTPNRARAWRCNIGEGDSVVGLRLGHQSMNMRFFDLERRWDKLLTDSARTCFLEPASRVPLPSKPAYRSAAVE